MAYFGVLDYILLVALLAASTAIGVYHSCTSGRKKTTAEFLLGNRNMDAIPITFSLLATFLSGATLLGAPTEVYVFGCQQAYFIFGFLLMFPTVIYCFMPVYYELGITSINEYLERRFNRYIRKVIAAIYILQTLLFMSVIIYGPSLALNQATGFSFWTCVLFNVGICTFYTSIGGIRAVMWTDVLQIIFVLIALLVIVVAGFVDVGGFSSAMKVSYEGKRLEPPDFDIDFRVRHSFWTQTLGCLFATLPHYGTSQAQVQRFLAAKSLATARRALWGNMIGWIIVTFIITIEGFIVYAKYHDCDPLMQGEITRYDQILPHFVTTALDHLTGFSGLFIACLLSGSLSTLSTALNALAAVTFEDFIKAFKWGQMSEAKATILVKVMAFSYGGICLACMSAVERFSTISEAALSIMGCIGGPILGVFVLGMFFPWTNSWGAGIGLLLGLTESLWLTLGARITNPPKLFLPVSISGCPANSSLTSNETMSQIFGFNYTTNYPTNYTTDMNFTSNYSTTPSFENVFSTELIQEEPSLMRNFYSISYMWYSMIACLIVIITGLIVSFATGPQDPKQLDPKLLSPLTRSILNKLSKKHRVYFKCDVADEVEMEKMQNGHDQSLIKKISPPDIHSTC